MAQIREELVLYDRFTNTFTKYLRYGEQAANVTNQAKKATDQYAQSQKAAAASTNTLADSIKSLIGGYVGLQGLRAVLNLSDTIASTTARLDMMNDGLQTTAELNNMIWESAQRSRMAYTDTAAFVAKLGNLAGNAFDSNADIINFAEQINKQIVLSGASATEASAALLQLTQGLSSGMLRGEELNSVLEQTPMIAQTIAKYMGVTTGEMRELASEGKVTAAVVKNAMLEAAEETNAKFEQMPMTWSQVWTSMQNIAIRALNPLLQALSLVANNLEILIPIILGVAGAFAVFVIAANWTKIAAAATTAYNFVVNLLSIGFGVLSGNTAAASAAVMQFNSALMASPITWILMIVLLVVSAFYALIGVINKLTDSSISATGIIAGTFMTLLALIGNSVVVPMQHVFAAFANFIANVFNDPVTAVKVLFYDMAINVIGFIQKIASGIESLINAIPGVEVNLTSGINSLYNTLQSKRTEAIASGSYKEYIKPMEYFDFTDAFTTGYNAGKNFNPFSMLGGTGAGNPMVGNIQSYDELLKNTAGTQKNTASIAKAVDMTQEDIKSLVDVAERRYVNNINLTSKTPVINISGQNTGHTAADRQNLANAIRDILIEESASGAVRSTARPTAG